MEEADVLDDEAVRPDVLLEESLQLLLLSVRSRDLPELREKPPLDHLYNLAVATPLYLELLGAVSLEPE